MFSAFGMGPATSGLGLCDIDSSRKSQKNIKKKVGKSLHGGIKPFISKMVNFEMSV